jgi:pimeloyl-ACP methyl ester carboxylesterase
LSIVGRITSGDSDSWFKEWDTAAQRLFAEAEAQLAAGHHVSARDSYLRASTYFRVSEFFLHAHPDDPRIYSAYKRSIQAYKACCALYDPPVLPVEIPYEGTTLPGYFHCADQSGNRRPLFIMHSGFDGSAEERHGEGARAAVERGYNVLTFNGPGQYGPIHRARTPFRPDWEKVVTPVVDLALTLPGVDPAKIALMGVSLGGYLAPRAAAFEQRIAALIANDGVYDYGVANLGRSVAPEQRAAVEAAIRTDQAPEIDRRLEETMNASPTANWALTHGMYVTGKTSPRAYVAATLDYHLRDGIAEKISCPTLVLDAEEDMFFKGQPEQLYEHLTCPKRIMHFTAAEGAGAHCQVGAHRFAFARVYDWLDGVFGLV